MNKGLHRTQTFCWDPFYNLVAEGAQGARGSPTVPDSPGAGSFVFHCACSVDSSQPRSWLGASSSPAVPGHDPPALPWTPLSGVLQEFPSLDGALLTLAPAARLLANSDYFSFSLLSWAPLFPDRRFLWTPGFKKTHTNILVSLS